MQPGRPVLVLSIPLYRTADPSGMRWLCLKHEGGGIAKRIEFSPIEIGPYRTEFEDIPLLTKDNPLLWVRVTTSKNGKSHQVFSVNGVWFVEMMAHGLAVRNYSREKSVVITYRDENDSRCKRKHRFHYNAAKNELIVLP